MVTKKKNEYCMRFVVHNKIICQNKYEKPSNQHKQIIERYFRKWNNFLTVAGHAERPKYIDCSVELWGEGGYPDCCLSQKRKQACKRYMVLSL